MATSPNPVMLIAPLVGEVLTQERATALVRALGGPGPDDSVDPKRFSVERRDGYTLQCENLMQALPELQAQRGAYLKERYPGERMNVAWGRLLSMARDGRLVIFTVRSVEDGRLLGSCWLMPYTSVNTSRQAVLDDMLYIRPEYRGGLMVVRLWRYAERAMFSLGVREATFQSAHDTGAARLAKFMGYRPIANLVKKAFDGDVFAGVPTRHQGASNDPEF